MQVRSQQNVMDAYRPRFSHGQRVQKRVDDRRGDLPLSEDYPADALPLSAEPSDPRLQAWERMALCAFGSGAMDSRQDQPPDRRMKEILHCCLPANISAKWMKRVDSSSHL